MTDIELVIKIPEEEYKNICLMSNDGIGMALYDWIANGIPKQRTGHWIPVSERLPEEDTECLVTVLHNEPYSFKYEYKVTEAYYAEYWGLFDDDYEGARILAWQPLPEPYKAESEVENEK